MSGPAERALAVAQAAQLRAALLVVLAVTLWNAAGLVFRLLGEAEQWRVVFRRSGLLVQFLLLLIRHRGGRRLLVLA